eukprot:1156257-Pelagomonas_calceolata.AAC.2
MTAFVQGCEEGPVVSQELLRGRECRRSGLDDKRILMRTQNWGRGDSACCAGSPLEGLSAQAE